MPDLSMTLMLNEREAEALASLADAKGTSKSAIMRQALRLYQLVEHRTAEGEKMYFSGDDKRMVEFIGIF